MADTLIGVKNIKKVFCSPKGDVRAVDGVSLRIRRGETLGLVGESGSGKSTVGRLITRLVRPTSGKILYCGRDITRLGERQFRDLRKDMQIVFQNPNTALDPKRSVRDLIAEPLLIHRIVPRHEIDREICRLLTMVGLPQAVMTKMPREFSGGEKQRICIARALSVGPRFLFLDEPVSSLDVSVQSKILNLLEDLKQELSLTYLLVAHGLNVVRHISDRVAVMYLGQIQEIGDTEELYEDPRHPYTQALISSFPEPDMDARRKRIVLAGEIPSNTDGIQGCVFHTRCPYVRDICRRQAPEIKMRGGRMIRCHGTGDAI